MLLLLGSLIAILQQVYSEEADPLILRSRSFNTISQLELIGKHEDTIMEYKRGMRQIDLAILISSKNISNPTNEKSDFHIKMKSILQIQGCSMGKIQKKIYQAALTSDTFYLRAPFDNAARMLELNTSILPVLKDNCTPAAGSKLVVECKFSKFQHTSLQQLDHFLLETRRFENTVDDEGRILKSEETTYLSSFFIESFTITKWPQTVAVAASILKVNVSSQVQVFECGSSELATAVKSYTRNPDTGEHRAEIYLMKWCTPQGNVPSETLSTPIDVFRITLRSGLPNDPSNVTYAGQLNSFVRVGATNQVKSFKMLDFLRPGLYTVILNQDSIMSIPTSVFLNHLSKLVPNSLPMSLSVLSDFASVASFCNQVTSTETSCVLRQYTSNQGKVRFYQVFELVSLDSNLLLIELPILVGSEGDDIHSAIITKNYLVMGSRQNLFACYKKQSGEVRLQSKGSSEKANCTQLELGNQDQTVQLFAPLVLEENQSNDIDGYVMVALRKSQIENQNNDDPEEEEEAVVRAFLITGPYFTFTIDTNLGSSVCERYFKECDSTSLTFTDLDELNRENSNEASTFEQKIFVLGSSFSSILARASSKKLTITKNSGLYGFMLSDFFFGDIVDPVFSKSVGFAYEKHLTTYSKKDYYATFAQSFMYSFVGLFDVNEFTFDQKAQDRWIKLDWVYIKYNSDNTFLFSVCYEYKIGDTSYLRIAKMNYAVELRPSTTTLDSSFFGQVTSDRASTYKNLLPLHNTDKDSVDFIRLDRITYVGDWKITVMQYYKDKVSEDPRLGSFNLIPLPAEKFNTIRTHISDKEDLFAVLTDKGVYICKFAKDLNREIKLLATIRLDDLIRDEEIPYFEVNDILLEDNVLLLDVEVYSMYTSGYTSRIYLYNLDISQGHVYSYGHITLSEEVVEAGYMLYYCKAVDKAILVNFGKSKTVIEYSLDNVFLDSTKLGKEITNDTWSTIDTYRDLVIESFLPLGPQSLKSSVQERRTLAVATEGSYMIVAKASNPTTKETQILILLGKIADTVLSVFKSHLMQYNPDELLVIPEAVSDKSAVSYMSLVAINKKSGVCNLVFFWKEDFVELHYRRIFDAEHSNDNSNQITEEIMVLEFRDTVGKSYVEPFTIIREKKYCITPIVFKQPVSTRIDSEKTGLVKNIGIECGDSQSETVGVIFRNMSQNILCKQDGRTYNLTLVNSMSKTSMLSLENSWKEVRDLVRLKSKHANLFVALEAKQLLIVKSHLDSLKQAVTIINDYTDDIDFSDCGIVKNAEHLADVVEISLLCNSKEGTKEYLYQFEGSLLDATEENNSTAILRFQKPKASYSLPEKIWIAVSSSKSNVVFTDELVFAKNSIFLFSVGEKYVLDLYHFNNSAQSGGPRYTLIKSLFYDKYSDFELLTFQAMKFVYPTKLPQFGLLQLFGEQHSTKLRLNYQIIKVEDPTSVTLSAPKTFNIEVKNNRGEEAVVLHAEVFSQVSAEIGSFYKNISHTFHVVLEDSAFEVSVYETNTKIGTSVISSLENKINQTVVYYNYGALCETGVEFRLRQTSDFLLLNCMPSTFDSTSNNLMVFRRNSSDNSRSYVNPIFTLPQLIGYTPKNSLQDIFRGEDGTWRIIKSSPRALLEQFTIHTSTQILTSLERADFQRKEFRLHLSNNYEVETLDVTINEHGWHDVSWISEHLPKDVAGLVVGTIYLVLLGCWLGFKDCWKRRQEKPGSSDRQQPEIAAPTDSESEIDRHEETNSYKKSFLAGEETTTIRKKTSKQKNNYQDMSSYLLNDLVL